MRDFSLIAEVREYNTAHDPTNAPEDILVGGSQNVLINRNHKVQIRNGYSRLGVANAALTPITNGVTWNSSTGDERPIREYDTSLEVYLSEIDGTTIDAWTNIKLTMTGNTPRFGTWYDDGEGIDLLLLVQGDANISEWGGGVAIVASCTANSITKAGTATFAQNRFYSARDMVLVNVRTGNEWTYTGGAGTLTLTGVTADPTGDLIPGDIIIQKPVTQSNKPASGRTNDTIMVFENQLMLGSFTDNQVFISKNTDYKDFSYSAPRVAGEGGLLTLDGPSGGLGALGSILVAFAGRDSIFRAEYSEVAVGTTISESLNVKKVKSGIDQGSQAPDCVIPIGNSLAYLSYEPALRILTQSDIQDSPSLKTLSNPIKPDFDSETWDNAKGIWYKNELYVIAVATSHTYILTTIEDADGKTSRFWQPPQILPISAYCVIDDKLHGHSNAVPETYLMGDGYSDINSSDEKLPIDARAAYAYRIFKSRAMLKNFDEYFTEGEINAATNDLLLTLNYDYGGHTQQLERTIDGTDEDILEENVYGSSLGQSPLAQQPIGGLLQTPSDARRFVIRHEIAREDFKKIQAVYSSNGVDKYWAILANGPNAVMSRRQDNSIKK